MTYCRGPAHSALLLRITYKKRQTFGVCPRAVVISVSGAALQLTHSLLLLSDADKSSCGALSSSTYCNNPFDAHLD